MDATTENKISKADAGYRVNPGPGGCEACKYDKHDYCAVVGEMVLPFACCNWWNKPNAPATNKLDAAYVIGGAPHDPILCSTCRFFVTDPSTEIGSCDKVNGVIKAEDTCNLWLPLDR